MEGAEEISIIELKQGRGWIGCTMKGDVDHPLFRRHLTMSIKLMLVDDDASVWLAHHLLHFSASRTLKHMII